MFRSVLIGQSNDIVGILNVSLSFYCGLKVCSWLELFITSFSVFTFNIKMEFFAVVIIYVCC